MAEAITLLESACSDGLACLDKHELLIAIAQALATTTMSNASQILIDACTSGIACLNEKQLLIVIAEAANEIMGGGGGGGAFVQKAGDTMTGALLIPDGTVGAPDIAFSGDTNTGLWRAGADLLGLAAGGVDVLRIQTGGPNISSGLAYLYNGAKIAYGQTALANYYFGPSGNLTGTGTDNDAIGNLALSSVTSGVTNVAIGSSALQSTTSGGSNMAIGYASILSNTTGSNNVAVGYQAVFSNVSGNSNTGIGLRSLFLATGSNNVGIGYLSGQSLTTGSGNIIIGINVDAQSATGSNQLTIGNLIIGTALDGSGTTLSSGSVGIAVASPTGRLHLPAGQTAASSAPLKFTPGNLMTSPEIGAVELTDDGTTGHFYVTLHVATVVTRVQIA